jgi:NAD(P)-dependent dehydrogenase (short-subunit alcohol dehydrogenase family)
VLTLGKQKKKFAYNSAKAAATHLTKMLATEIALKGIPVRVNSVAPGVYASEMTFDSIVGPEEMARVAQSLLPVPAGRAGTYVDLRCLDFRYHLTHSPQSWRNRRYSDLSIITSRVLYQWAGDCGRWKLYCRQSFYGLISNAHIC